MNFKNIIITAGAIVSSAYVGKAVASTVTPHNITSLKQSASYEHRTSHLSKQPNAPRLVSPAQYQRLQMLMTHDDHPHKSMFKTHKTMKKASVKKSVSSQKP